jgi:hypothetical protein
MARARGLRCDLDVVAQPAYGTFVQRMPWIAVCASMGCAQRGAAASITIAERHDTIDCILSTRTAHVVEMVRHEFRRRQLLSITTIV